MQILIIQNDPKVTDLFTLIVESGLDFMSVKVNSVEELEYYFKHKKECHLAIVNYAREDLDNILTCLGKVPVLFTGEKSEVADIKQQGQTYRGKSAIIAYNAGHAEIETAIRIILDSHLKKTVSKKTNDFYRLHLNFIIRESVAPCDLFLKIDGKHVKIYKRGTPLAKDDILKYSKKNVQYFLVSGEDYFEFTKRLTLTLDNTLDHSSKTSKGESSISSLSSLSLFTHEHVHQIINKIGIKKEIIELAQKATQALVRITKNDPKITDLLKFLMKRNNFLSEHSMMISHLTCAVASELSWSNESVVLKLCTASFFHDITLSDPDVAKVRDTNSKAAAVFEKRTLNAYVKHPFEAVELLHASNKFPVDSDVDKIILQHHENPQGTGFPRKIDEGKITPFGALFIVSEHFIEETFRLGVETVNLDQIVADFEKIYNYGKFSNVLAGLKRAIKVEQS